MLDLLHFLQHQKSWKPCLNALELWNNNRRALICFISTDTRKFSKKGEQMFTGWGFGKKSKRLPLLMSTFHGVHLIVYFKFACCSFVRRSVSGTLHPHSSHNRCQCSALCSSSLGVYFSVLKRFSDEELILIKPYQIRCVSTRIGFKTVIEYPTE